MHPRRQLGAAVAVGLFVAVAGVLVTIDNTHPRLDTDGNIVDAHDGSLLLDPVSGRFWLYGTHYQRCPVVPPPPSPGDCVNKSCGWFGNTFAAYSSATLESGSWRLESADIAPGMAANNSVDTYFMPNVLYNADTRLYVLAFNSQTPSATALVATSSHAAGPFTIMGRLPLTYPCESQLDLWLDPADGTAYARYNAALGQCVEALDATFTRSNGSVTCFDTGVGFLEGGGVFRRGAAVYVMAGSACCFCPSGGSARTYVSQTGPLGQYEFVGDANPEAPCNASQRAAAAAPRPVAALSVSASGDPCVNLTGSWLAFDTPGCPTPSSVVVSISMTGDCAHRGVSPMAPLMFEATDPQWDAPGNGTLAGSAVAFTGRWGGGTTLVDGILRSASATATPCSEIQWTSPGHTEERWCREGQCALGGGFAVPAQQFQVLAIPVIDGGKGSVALVFFGERWGSAPSGLKADDFQVRLPCLPCQAQGRGVCLSPAQR